MLSCKPGISRIISGDPIRGLFLERTGQCSGLIAPDVFVCEASVMLRILVDFGATNDHNLKNNNTLEA